MKILSIGEIIWDVYPDKNCIGGAPFNFTAHASLLGAQTALISAVGFDELGKSALEYAAKFGISHDFIKKNEYQTGICDVRIDERGIPSYSVRENTAYDNIDITNCDVKRINECAFDLLCFGTLIQRSRRSRAALMRVINECKFKEILCDVNLRVGCYSKESALTCLECATILKISTEEEPLLRQMGLYEPKEATPNEIARAIAEKYKNIRIILITMGENGAFVYESRTQSSLFFPARVVKVVSTVGAGDSFCAAFCTELLRGKSLSEAMNAAIELSAYVVSKSEAVPLGSKLKDQSLTE